MGCGIAHVCAVSGFDVYLADISTEALERALSNMTDSLDHQVSKGKISEATRTAALDRISTGTGIALFSECDLVIEAVTENAVLCSSRHQIRADDG
jgi:3-hydroxybutyryl-CoA dehydrogenase